MNEDYKEITILLRIFNISNDQYEYWKSIYLNNEDISIKFLIDDSELLHDYSFLKKNDIYFIGKNQGPLKLVYNYIKNTDKITRYFKTFDPDDFLSIENFKKIKLPKDDFILTMKETQFISPPLIKSDKYVTNLINQSHKYHWESFGTSWTILPTRFISIDKYYNNYRILFADDKLLGYLCRANGAKIINFSCRPFYYYIKNAGLTSPENMINNIDEIIKSLKYIRNLWLESNFKRHDFYPDSLKWHLKILEEYDGIISPEQEKSISRLKRLTDLFELKELNDE